MCIYVCGCGLFVKGRRTLRGGNVLKKMGRPKLHLVVRSWPANFLSSQPKHTHWRWGLLLVIGINNQKEGRIWDSYYLGCSVWPCFDFILFCAVTNNRLWWGLLVTEQPDIVVVTLLVSWYFHQTEAEGRAVFNMLTLKSILEKRMRPSQILKMPFSKLFSVSLGLREWCKGVTLWSTSRMGVTTLFFPSLSFLSLAIHESENELTCTICILGVQSSCICPAVNATFLCLAGGSSSQSVPVQSAWLLHCQYVITTRLPLGKYR